MEVQVLSSAQKSTKPKQRKEEKLDDTFVARLIGSDLGFRDDSDPLKQIIRAKLVVDITPLCCGIDNRQKLVMYAWKFDGTLVVQLLTCFFVGNPAGSRKNFFIGTEEIDNRWCDVLTTDSEFIDCCKSWGLVDSKDVQCLAEIIFEKAPNTNQGRKNERG